MDGSVTRFACIGDTHLFGGSRNADRLRVLRTIVAEGLRVDGLGAWVHVGDLFDARSSAENRNACDELFQEMADRAPILVVRGNHDLDGELEGFARLAARWPIIVVTSAQCVRLTCATSETATVFCLPFPEKSILVSSGVAPADIPQAAAVALDAIFIGAGAELAAARKAGDITLMVGHGTIRGATSSVGQPMGLERDIAIDASQLDRLGPIAKVWGHIHKPQEIHGAHYVGSICATDWGETGDHRFLVVDVTADSSFTVESRRIDTPAMWHVECDLSRAGATNMRATAGPDGETLEMPSSWKGAEVRVRCRYHQSEGSILESAQAHVKTQFSDALRFEFEPICVPDRALRAPEVAVARTLGEKLRAWSTVAGVVLPDDAAAKAEALDGPEADAVIADVEQRMAALIDLSNSSVDVAGSPKNRLGATREAVSAGEPLETIPGNFSLLG